MKYDLKAIAERSIEVPFSGCWIWMNCLSYDGYSQIGSAPWSGHKAAYEAKFGPTPSGLELHHTCSVRCCVNPDHIQAVTHHQNVLASPSIGTKNQHANKTHCIHGHEFTHENTIIERNKTKRGYARRCRQCRRDRGKGRMR
jgi:hypothetical protein